MPEPCWKGPYVDGVTQSLVSKFLTCRHRFWLYAICGAVDQQGLNIPLVYGDAYHNALETYAFGKVPAAKAGERIKDYFHTLSKTYPQRTNQIGEWSRICYDQFLAYCKHWEQEDQGFESFMAEETFNVPYTLPSGRVVRTRGKFDGGVISGTLSKHSRLLAEHKIKGEVEATYLGATLTQNMQCMFYMPPLYQKMDAEGQPRPDGVLYNVIQRPLAGRKHSIKQKKGRKVKVKGTNTFEIKGAETMEQYHRRVAALYPAHPDDFFYRWRVSISEAEVTRFQKESLDPILESLCDWWDSIQGDPFNPWEVIDIKQVTSYDYAPKEFGGMETISRTREEKKVSRNKHHYRRPFGIYDKMAKGLVGDYQDYLTKGDKSSLQRITTVFPELE